MSARLLAILFLSVVTVTSLSGQIQQLEGLILDAADQQPLLGANIWNIKEQRGTSSNAEGRFTLNYNQLPIQLEVSYLGYEKQVLTIEEQPDSILTIVLKTDARRLKEVIVRSEVKEEVLSNVEEYTVVRFEIFGDKIVRLDYYDMRTKYQLKVLDLEGNQLNAFSLRDLKGIEDLYRSCRDNPFLMTRDEAIELELDGNELAIVQRIPRKTFEYYIEPCQASSGAYAFYTFEAMNGLAKIFKSYNHQTEESREIRVVSEQQQIYRLFEDIGKMAYGNVVHNLGVKNWVENQTLRRAQAEADFLGKVYYKPDQPTPLFVKGREVLLFNHLEERLEVYSLEGQLRATQNLTYVEDKKWTKEVLQDRTTGQIYVLFDRKGGWGLREIDDYSGQLTDNELMLSETPLDQLVVANGSAYYLKLLPTTGQRILARKRLF